MSTDYETKRILSDVQSRIASLDYNVMAAAQRARPRPGGLVARYAACKLLAHAEKRQPEDVARQYFGNDRDLNGWITRAASGPAQAGVAGFAAELLRIITLDLADNMPGVRVRATSCDGLAIPVHRRRDRQGAVLRAGCLRLVRAREPALSGWRVVVKLVPTETKKVRRYSRNQPPGQMSSEACKRCWRKI